MTSVKLVEILTTLDHDPSVTWRWRFRIPQQAWSRLFTTRASYPPSSQMTNGQRTPATRSSTRMVTSRLPRDTNCHLMSTSTTTCPVSNYMWPRRQTTNDNCGSTLKKHWNALSSRVWAKSFAKSFVLAKHGSKKWVSQKSSPRLEQDMVKCKKTSRPTSGKRWELCYKQRMD